MKVDIEIKNYLEVHPQSMGVPRNPLSSVLQQDVDSGKELKSVLPKPRLWSRMLLRSSVLFSPSVPASKWLKWCPNWSTRRNVLIYPRRSVPN